MDTAYLHALDPFMVRFSDSFGIRWYGMSYAVGFLVTYLIVRWMGKRQITQVPVHRAGDFIFALAMGTFLGGRLGYVLFYRPDLLLHFSSEAPFWGVLAINQGGMASHGAILGIIAACLIFSRLFKINFLHLVDLTAIGGSVGVFFGRIANFINGELVGRPCPADFPLAVKFPQDILLWPGQDFSKLQPLADTVQAMGGSVAEWNRNLQSFAYSDAARASVFDTLGRIIVGIQQGNQAAADALRPLLTARYPSQLFEALLEGLLIVVLLTLIWRRARKPGVIAGCYFIIYALVRIYGEQFRMPDAHLGFQWLGLTRGQILSVALLGFGLCWLIYCLRRKAPAVGGWKDRVDPIRALGDASASGGA